jgi:hypothetical protein
MPRFWLLGVIGLVGCSGPEFKQQRLQDGSLQIQCDLAMDECVRRAQDLCNNQRFRILEGTSETRLMDAPPFERAYRTSRLHLKCTNDGAEPLLSFDRQAAASASASAQPLAPTPACTVGETRACVGPGACQGGQSCLADRSGFGACDCGPAVAPTPPAVNEPVAPATPSTPATPATPVP